LPVTPSLVQRQKGRKRGGRDRHPMTLHTPQKLTGIVVRRREGGVRSISHTHQGSSHVLRPDMALHWTRQGDCGYTTRKHARMCPKRKVMAMRIQRKWVGTIVIVAMLLLISAVPGHPDRGGDGYRGHGYRGYGYRGHGYRRHHGYGGPRVFIRPRIVVPFGPYWSPYWEPYPYPPVVIAPSPPVYVQPSPPVVAQPSPPTYWYYCDAAQAYYPYVQQCPGGWRPVTPTPP
jgi:hypothetical protein